MCAYLTKNFQTRYPKHTFLFGLCPMTMAARVKLQHPSREKPHIMIPMIISIIIIIMAVIITNLIKMTLWFSF